VFYIVVDVFNIYYFNFVGILGSKLPLWCENIMEILVREQKHNMQSEMQR